MARVNERSHCFIGHITFIDKWNESCLSTPHPQSITTLWPILVSHPAEGWPVWLVTYRGGLLIRRRASIPVLTGPDVE